MATRTAADRASLMRPLLAALAALLAGVPAAAEVCTPTLTVTGERMSEIRPPASARLWFAVIAVEASRCSDDASGHFDLVLSRTKENAPDLEFRERFAWQPPSVTVGIDFGPDEAVGRYRIDAVTPCPCARNAGAGARTDS
jgi:hypothetical protein